MRTARVSGILALWMLALTPVESRAGAASDATARHDALSSTPMPPDRDAAGRDRAGRHARRHRHHRRRGTPTRRRRLR